MYGQGGLRMEDMGRMVHVFLKGTVKMRECACTTSKPEFFAQIIAAFKAIIAVPAHNARLDGHSLADDNILDAGTNRSHDTSSFVTED
jgi:hypothetical protein